MLSPPLEKAREHLLEQLDKYVSAISSLPRVTAGRLEVRIIDKH